MTKTANGQLTIISGGPEKVELYADQIVDLDESDFLDPKIRDDYLREVDPQPFRQVLLDDWAKAPRFTVVTLWNAEELVGFICGCAPVPGWSSSLIDPIAPLPENLSADDESNVVSLTEIIIKRNRRGQGLGHQVHTLFLESRHEDWVSLLSQPQFQPAYSIWQHWGYRKIGKRDPDKNGRRISDVFIRARNPQ